MTLLRKFFLALKNSIVVFFIVRMFILPVALLVAGGILFFIFENVVRVTGRVIDSTIVITCVLVVLVLAILLILETAKLHTLRKLSRRNINLFVAFVYLAFAGTVYYLLFADRLRSTHESPCGDGYTASVYTKPRLFAAPGDGGSGSNLVFVVVRNRWGWPVAKSNDDCSVFYDDVEIGWDCDRHELNFARARSLNLVTGECSY